MDRIQEELRLLRYSLLPDESITFVEDCEYWEKFLEDENPDGSASSTPLACTFETRVLGIKTWFEITLQAGSQNEIRAPRISVKGEDMTRTEQEKWQTTITQRLDDIGESEYPIYQLVSLHLLPLLRESHDKRVQDEPVLHSVSNGSDSSPTYHALFTSHHLISPNKRRSLQHWSSSLHVTGFAKVGYPGVIYLEGKHGDVEEFVENVKGMQWLALRLRFIEPLPTSAANVKPERQWLELQKVGEVVQEMKLRGRETYVLDLGIGSVGRDINVG